MLPNDSFTRKRDSKCRQLGIGDLDDTKSAPHTERAFLSLLLLFRRMAGGGVLITRRTAAAAAVLPAHAKVTVDMANCKKECDRHEHTDDKGCHRNPSLSP